MSVDFADKFDIVITAINNQMITSNDNGNLHLLFVMIKKNDILLIITNRQLYLDYPVMILFR